MRTIFAEYNPQHNSIVVSGWEYADVGRCGRFS